MSCLGDVETREPDRRRHDIEEAEDPLRRARCGELELVDEERRRHAEAHDVHQTVQLLSEPRPGSGEPRDAAVEHVEDPAQEDVPPGAVELAPRGQHHRPDAEEQVEQGE